MTFGGRHRARRRALGAGLVGIAGVAVFGPTLAVPAVALVAFVYYVHQVVATLRGDPGVPYPSLALTVTVNAAVVLAVQLLLAAESLGVF
ncbi:MAG: hypothetical protein KatS3mg013_1379 [Actinomycetota bacterium]|nr:MAG: hypothetical protein KatS3mg013_1379 [Actinomycetota bacterium]